MKRILSVFVKFQKPQERSSAAQNPASHQERIEWLLPLAKALYRFSPAVAFDDYSREESCGERIRGIAKRLHEPSDPWSFGLNLDVTGCERLFSGEEELLRKVSETVAFHGFLSRMTIAPTLGMSWGQVRFGKERVSIVSHEELRHRAELLPVQAFRLSRKELAALAELEVKTGGELLRMPRAALLERFGGGILKRIDQLLARADEALPRCRISFPVRCSKEFDVPVDNDRMLASFSRRLLEEFLSKVKETHQRLSSFRIEILGPERQLFRKDFRLSAPSTDLAYIGKLIEPLFESLAFPGGVQSLQFSSLSAEPQQKLQLPSEHEGRESFAQLLDVIGEHLGPEGDVQQVACFPSHVPERSYAFVPRGSPAVENGVFPVHSEDRPSILFYRPSPVRVIAPLPDGPPAWLEWKEHRYRVAKAIGPERIAPPWWGRDDERFRTKDYFRVQVPTGSWLWIFRENTEWFVHGVWT